MALPTHSNRFIARLGRGALYTFAAIAVIVIGGALYYVATLYTPRNPQQATLALIGATVLVGPGLEPQADGTVLIQDGVITAVGSAAEITPPANAAILDVAGYTLLPGLIDLHVHLGSPALEPGQPMGPARIPGILLDYVRFHADKRRALLEHGVTTVRSVGDDYAWIMDVRHRLRAGELEGPRLYAAGPIFTTPGGHPVVTIGVEPDSDGVRLPATPDEAQRMVAALATADDRVDLIKIVQERGGPTMSLEPLDQDVLHAIVEAAHSHELPVFAHWGTLEDLAEVVEAGVDGLEHLEPRAAQDEWPAELLVTLVERDISITPTLVVLEAATRRPRFPLPLDAIEVSQQRLLEFHATGGRVVAGSDAGMPGVPFGAGLQRELELLVASGLSPQAALQAATSHAAHALRAGHIGVIEPGRAADLLLVDGDPLIRIQEIRNVVMVIRDGRLVIDRRDR